MLLEGRESADDALVLEAGNAPLELLLDVGASLVEKRPQRLEDRPGKRLGALDVGVNLRVVIRHVTPRLLPRAAPGPAATPRDRNTGRLRRSLGTPGRPRW